MLGSKFQKKIYQNADFLLIFFFVKFLQARNYSVTVEDEEIYLRHNILIKNLIFNIFCLNCLLTYLKSSIFMKI